MITNPANTIFVSMIHKAKGRVFDTVYMNLNQYEIQDDEQRHVLYVGMTRARDSLFINENNGLLEGVYAKGAKQRQENSDFDQNTEILLPLGHKDIWLDYCLTTQQTIRLLHSGSELFLQSDWSMYSVLNNKKYSVLRLSKHAITEISRYLENGYEFSRAEVRFLVYWYPQDKPEKEGLIVLPDLYLKKKSDSEN